MKNLTQIPQKQAIVHRLQGKVEQQGPLSVGGVAIPPSLVNRFHQRCKDYKTLQEAVDHKNLYLRGRETSQGIHWFGLTTDDFKPFPVSEIEKAVSETSTKYAIRYMPDRERFLLNYEINSVPQKLHLYIDSGDFGVYGGNGQSALKAGLSMFDWICTNWTMFLHQVEKTENHGKREHRQETPDIRSIIGRQMQFADTVMQKWEESKDIVLGKEVFTGYAKAYTERMGQKNLFGRVLEDLGARASVYDIAYSITQEAQQLADLPRARMEMLAGELVLCPDKIKQAYQSGRWG